MLSPYKSVRRTRQVFAGRALCCLLAYVLTGLIAFGSVAKAETINLQCHLVVNPTMPPWRYWIDSEKNMVTVASPTNDGGIDERNIQSYPVTVTPDIYTWKEAGGHNTVTINRRSGMLTYDYGPVQVMSTCEKGNMPLPATKF